MRNINNRSRKKYVKLRYMTDNNYILYLTAFCETLI